MKRSSDPGQVGRRTMTIPEAARLLGISRNGAYEAAKRREIPTIRIGRRLLVPVVALDRLLDQSRVLERVEARP
jgi:excisionase family DNA binding protein